MRACVRVCVCVCVCEMNVGKAYCSWFCYALEVEDEIAAEADHVDSDHRPMKLIGQSVASLGREKVVLLLYMLMLVTHKT